jgi:hypothetical protein
MSDQATIMELSDFRQRIANGYSPTKEEVARAISILRAHRSAAVVEKPKSSTSKTTKGAAAMAELDSLLGDL